LKCLLVFKTIEKDKDVSLLDSLCESLAKCKVFNDIGKEGKEESRISSIKQKIYNIHSYSKKKIPGFSIKFFKYNQRNI